MSTFSVLHTRNLLGAVCRFLFCRPKCRAKFQHRLMLRVISEVVFHIVIFLVSQQRLAETENLFNSFFIARRRRKREMSEQAGCASHCCGADVRSHGHQAEDACQSQVKTATPPVSPDAVCVMSLCCVRLYNGAVPPSPLRTCELCTLRTLGC